MAETSFDPAMAFVLKAEGGYVDNPRDPGGATNMGITLRTLSDWRGTTVTKAQVKSLPKDEAEAILGAHYWNSTHCGQLPAGVDLMVFDAAVNMGVGTSAKMLQAAVGADQDGSIGPMTLAAVAQFQPFEIISDLKDRRTAHYRSLSTFEVFGRGWLNRVASVYLLATTLATAGAQ
jgi:lysozyme family protein